MDLHKLLSACGLLKVFESSIVDKHASSDEDEDEYLFEDKDAEQAAPVTYRRRRPAYVPSTLNETTASASDDKPAASNSAAKTRKNVSVKISEKKPRSKRAAARSDENSSKMEQNAAKTREKKPRSKRAAAMSEENFSIIDQTMTKTHEKKPRSKRVAAATDTNDTVEEKCRTKRAYVRKRPLDNTGKKQSVDKPSLDIADEQANETAPVRKKRRYTRRQSKKSENIEEGESTGQPATILTAHNLPTYSLNEAVTGSCQVFTMESFMTQANATPYFDHQPDTANSCKSSFVIVTAGNDACFSSTVNGSSAPGQYSLHAPEEPQDDSLTGTAEPTANPAVVATDFSSNRILDIIVRWQKRILTTRRSVFMCYCGRMHTTKNALMRHRLRVHSSIETFACEVCAKKTLVPEENLFSRLSLLMHVRRVHTTHAVFCLRCEKGFRRLAALCRHRRLHGGRALRHRPSMCTTCGKLFCVEQQLQLHMLSGCNRGTPSTSKHQGIPLTCPTCHKQFSSEDRFMLHRDRGCIFDAL